MEFATAQTLAALVVEDGGLVTLAEATSPPAYNVLNTRSLTFVEDGSGVAIGALDLKNNGFIVDYASSLSGGQVDALRTDIRGWLIDGRDGTGLGQGHWTGSGITSSIAAAANAVNQESRAVGYGVNVNMPLGAQTTFLGQSVDSSSIIGRYTVTGDADLDGSVGDADVTIISATYNEPGNGDWFLGDLDYDGDVDDADATLLGAFYDPTYDIDEDPDP